MIVCSEVTEKCQLCGSERLKPIALTIRKNMPHICRVKCGSCGLVISSPMATQATLNDYYENYFTVGHHNSVTEGIGFIKRLESAEKTLSEIAEYCGGGKFLDVGSGSGHVCYAAVNSGFDAYGVDLSSSGVRFSKEKFGLKNIYCGEIFDCSFGGDSFDVIHCWHLIEHVRDPLAYLTEMNRLLKTGGYLYWGTDNHNSLGYRLLRIFCFLTLRIPPIYDGVEHTFGFDKKTMLMSLRKAGFESLTIKTYPDKFSFSEIIMDVKKYGILKAIRTIAQSIFHVKMKGVAVKKRL